MAKRKPSISIIAGLAAGLGMTVKELITSGSLDNAMRTLGRAYTGFDYGTGRFDINELKKGALPLLIAGLVKAGLTKMNVGRAMAGLPVGP